MKIQRYDRKRQDQIGNRKGLLSDVMKVLFNLGCVQKKKFQTDFKLLIFRELA